MKLVRSGFVTYAARLDGEPGEVHATRCALCSGELRAGDGVFVTEKAGRVHAMAHHPDCVHALERERSEADARALVAEADGNDRWLDELREQSRRILSRLDDARLTGAGRA